MSTAHVVGVTSQELFLASLYQSADRKSADVIIIPRDTPHDKALEAVTDAKERQQTIIYDRPSLDPHLLDYRLAIRALAPISVTPTEQARRFIRSVRDQVSGNVKNRVAEESAIIYKKILRPVSLSVIIAYDFPPDNSLRCDNLLTCLQALQDQTLDQEKFELLIGEVSTDENTVGRLGHTVFFPPAIYNKGRFWNELAKVASGSHLVFLDSDILISPNTLQVIHDTFTETNAVMVKPLSQLIKTNAETRQAILKMHMEDALTHTNMMPRTRNYPSGLFAMSKAGYIYLGGTCTRYDGWGYEDHDFIYKCEKSEIVIVKKDVGPMIHMYHPNCDFRPDENLGIFEERKSLSLLALLQQDRKAW